jgi:LysM repeat protein
MRKILPWLFAFVFTAFLARAQDDAAQQQVDKLSGQIQDLQESVGAQDKKIAALEKQIADLGDKLNAPAASDSASADDLKKLAAQVQEIDKKRQDDNNLILKELEKLGKGGNVSTGHKPSPSVSTTTTTPDNSPATGGQQNGYYYPVASGDTIAAIAKAYHAKGVKVTTGQILAANPGLNPNNLKVGQKIFIPDANAK